MKRLPILLALTALLFVGTAETAAARAPKMFHGVMWDRGALRAGPELQRAQWPLMARSGVDSVRVVFSWAAAQPTALGPIDYSETDALVELATRNRIRLLPTVLYTPYWAKKYPDRSGSPPEHATDYAAFMRRLVQRYGPRGSFWAEHKGLRRQPIREWQIWNEPHYDIFWFTPGGWVPEYVQLLRQSSRAIHAADRGARVVLAGFADETWKILAKVMRAGAGRSFDVATVHVFTRSPGFVVGAAELARRVLTRFRRPRVPIWVTETAFPAAMGKVPPERLNPWQRTWWTTDRGMARRVTRLYRLGALNARRLGLRRIYWYTWASGYDDPGDLFEYSGLVRITDGEVSRRPALRAYRRSAHR